MQVKKLLLASCALGFIPGGPMMAADLPAAMRVKAPPPVSPAAASWTGLYVGVSGGAAWLRTGFNAIDLTLLTAHGSARDLGFIVGGTVGYNLQLQNVVLGVEGDLNWTALKAFGTTNGYGGGPHPFSADLGWLATVRGRLGFLITPMTLAYATGGYAAGRIKYNSTDLAGFVGESSRSGWTAGGGIEFMLARHWTVKAEALYVDLGTSTIQGLGGAGYIASFSDSAVIARMGANFKF